MASKSCVKNPFLSQEELNKRLKLQNFLLTPWGITFGHACFPAALVLMATVAIMWTFSGLSLTVGFLAIANATWTIAGVMVTQNVRLRRGRVKLEELKKIPENYTFGNQVMDILKPIHHSLMQLPPAERVSHRQLWENALVLSKALEKNPQDKEVRMKLKLRRDAIQDVVIARNALERADREDRERMVRESESRDLESMDNSDLLAARADARALLAGADRLRSFSQELVN